MLLIRCYYFQLNKVNNAVMQRDKELIVVKSEVMTLKCVLLKYREIGWLKEGAQNDVVPF